MRETICLLPGGYIDNKGVLHQEAALKPLSGWEEEFLADNRHTNSAVVITAILSRCVQRIGIITPVPEKIIRQLLVADRQFLLLKLREITFGQQVQATILCPWPHCGHKVDIDFSITDIPIIESRNKALFYTMTLSEGAAFISESGEAYRKITFRLPNGEDQEIISPLLAQNEARALAMLLERCVQRIESLENLPEAFASRLSPLARMEIEKQMEILAPKIELTMQANCPNCNREFAVPFELQDFLFGELRTSSDLLYREVHYLAYHYHWSEREIMAMTRDKRRKYIEILADEIERLNNAV